MLCERVRMHVSLIALVQDQEPVLLLRCYQAMECDSKPTGATEPSGYRTDGITEPGKQEALLETMNIKPRKPKLWLYLDYNGVLNQEGTENLMDFIILVDSFRNDVDLDIILVSKARKNQPDCCNVTCNEIADAGVLNVFTKLVFTTGRCAPTGTLRRPCTVMEFDYRPLSPSRHHGLPELRTIQPDSCTDHEFRRQQRRTFNVCFDFFYGGKDQFIYSEHKDLMVAGPESPDRIIFVDDKSDNLEAVYALNWLPDFRGRVRCVEMRRKIFHTGSWARKTHNLKELYAVIQISVQELVDNHDGDARQPHRIQNAVTQRWNTVL